MGGVGIERGVKDYYRILFWEIGTQSCLAEKGSDKDLGVRSGLHFIYVEFETFIRHPSGYTEYIHSKINTSRVCKKGLDQKYKFGIFQNTDDI